MKHTIKEKLTTKAKQWNGKIKTKKIIISNNGNSEVKENVTKLVNDIDTGTVI